MTRRRWYLRPQPEKFIRPSDQYRRPRRACVQYHQQYRQSILCYIPGWNNRKHHQIPRDAICPTLRLRKPIPPLPVKGIQQALEAGPACAQQTLSPIPFIRRVHLNALDFALAYISTSLGGDPVFSEDCLSINIWRPTAVYHKPLPVLVWLYGGAFEVGSNTDQSPLALIERSIAIDEPIMFVAANSIIGSVVGLGWMGGREVKEAGISNLGLHDQRLAFQWIQKHIHAFGGDPGQVIISGLSAGAISTAAQLLINEGDTENLFHGAFMISGAPMHYPAVDSPKIQETFDSVVRGTNCTGSDDPLACLRKVPFELLWPIINATATDAFSYSGVDLVWRPILKQSGLCAVSNGRFANIPIITGNSDDEGTLFALSNLNVTTDAEFLEYEQSYVLPGATTAQIAQVANAYPSDPSFGSPFDTGDNSALTPEYKRMAAIAGDMVFLGPRRHLLQTMSQKRPNQKSWSYLNKRGKFTPNLGAFHASDVLALGIWFSADTDKLFGSDAIIHFVNTLDPNGQGEVFWPQWDSSASANLLTFADPLNITITSDTFRTEEMKLLLEIQQEIEEKNGLC
ncbi:sterol esterase [Mycena floridula]|nr:sterol esterase [Mycena floridula]